MKHIMLNSYVPKVGQRIILENLSPYTYALIHRQYGKSELAYKLSESELLKKKYISPLVSITTPTIVQGRAIYEQKFKDNFKVFNPTISQNKILKFTRPGGAVCRVEWFGADNFSDSDRGRTTVFNILDEYGSIPFGFAQQNIFPFGLVHKANNFIIGTTSKGANHFKYEFDKALSRHSKGDKDFFALKWTILDSLKHNEISQKDFDTLRKQYDNPKYEHIWRGEYLMDWYAYSLDKIYAQEVSNCFGMGRIGYFPHIEGIYVDTFWDIGLNGTAVWFMQKHQGKHRFIKFIEANNKVHFQSFIIKNILPLQQKYKFRYHVFPQDVKQGEFMSKQTRHQVARQLLKDNVQVFEGTGYTKSTELIDYARRNFERCIFDEKGCAEGIRRLNAYALNKQNRPIKNEDSHGSDAFTYAQNWSDLFLLDDEKNHVNFRYDRILKPYYRPKTVKWWG